MDDSGRIDVFEELFLIEIVVVFILELVLVLLPQRNHAVCLLYTSGTVSHTPLKRARLPIPPRPPIMFYLTH